MQTWWKDLYNTHERVGKVLKEKRLEAKVTQKTISTFIRCSQAALSSLERGQHGSLKLVDAYATALGLDLGDLKIGAPSGMHSLGEARKPRKPPRKVVEAAAVRWVKRHRHAA